MILRYVGYLLLGVGGLLVAMWALQYLVTPIFFRPGAASLVFIAVLAVGATAFALRSRPDR